MTRYSFQIFKLRILGFVELMSDCSCFNVSSFKFMLVLVTHPWAYGKEKIRGAERNLPDFFGLCPRCQKKISGETFQNCCRRGGGGGRSDYEKFLLDSIFPTKLTEFPTKLTEFVPFIFIISQYCPTVKRILPDWLCLANKLGGGGGGLPPPPPRTPMNTSFVVMATHALCVQISLRRQESVKAPTRAKPLINRLFQFRNNMTYIY